jgi:hypothetical protein
VPFIPPAVQAKSGHSSTPVWPQCEGGTGRTRTAFVTDLRLTFLHELQHVADLAAQRMAVGWMRISPDEVEALLRFQQTRLEDLATRLTPGPVDPKIESR